MRLLLGGILGFLLLLIWKRKQKEATAQNIARAETRPSSVLLTQLGTSRTDVVALSEREPQGRPAVDDLEALSGKPLVRTAFSDPSLKQVWVKDGIDRTILWQQASIQ